jgi:hypothetical protein
MDISKVRKGDRLLVEVIARYDVDPGESNVLAHLASRPHAPNILATADDVHALLRIAVKVGKTYRWGDESVNVLAVHGDRAWCKGDNGRHTIVTLAGLRRIDDDPPAAAAPEPEPSEDDADVIIEADGTVIKCPTAWNGANAVEVDGFLAGRRRLHFPELRVIDRRPSKA